MMTGKVSNRRAYIERPVIGPKGQGNVEFVIDTGFTGVLTLPPAACEALGLVFDRLQPSALADESILMLEVFIVTLVWDGEERKVEVLAIEGEPLIGMTMLDGYDVLIQVTEGGAVILSKRTIVSA